MVNIKSKLLCIREKNILAKNLFYVVKKISYLFPNYKLERKAKQRKNGFEDAEYIKLRMLQNRHLNDRCFIVATGPSLTFEDLSLLKNEICFGMNSICKILDKTDWRPTYFGIQDALVYEKLEKEIKENIKCDVFVGANLKEDFDIPDKYIVFPFNHLYHLAEIDIDKYYSLFSDNCYAMIYDGYSITYSLIQIAVYMGFKEIYLLGCDCNYPSNKQNHFVESGFVDKYAYKNYDKMITGYKAAKKYADAHNIKIINCTRGGMLEVFPRMKLEDVLRNS